MMRTKEVKGDAQDASRRLTEKRPRSSGASEGGPGRESAVVCKLETYSGDHLDTSFSTSSGSTGGSDNDYEHESNENDFLDMLSDMYEDWEDEKAAQQKASQELNEVLEVLEEGPGADTSRPNDLFDQTLTYGLHDIEGFLLGHGDVEQEKPPSVLDDSRCSLSQSDENLQDDKPVAQAPKLPRPCVGAQPLVNPPHLPHVHSYTLPLFAWSPLDLTCQVKSNQGVPRLPATLTSLPLLPLLPLLLCTAFVAGLVSLFVHAASCAACRSKKILCDRAAPSCTYCVKKGLQCSIPPSVRRGRPPKEVVRERKEKEAAEAMRQPAVHLPGPAHAEETTPSQPTTPVCPSPPIEARIAMSLWGGEPHSRTGKIDRRPRLPLRPPSLCSSRPRFVVVAFAVSVAA